nr:cysteine-rich RLK (receptor-like protein kinase) 8 [Tanacetum cinerariifolium]
MSSHDPLGMSSVVAVALFGSSIESTALFSKQDVKGKCSICGFKWHPPEKCWEKVGYPVWHHKHKQNKASNQSKSKGGTNDGNFKKTAASVTSGASSFTFTSEKVMGLGKKIAGLYHLLNVHMDSVDEKIKNMVDSRMSSGLFSCSAGIYNKSVCTNMFSLWHHRLGHLPVSKMKHIQCNDVSTMNETGSTCLNCPMAKLTRLPFSLSDSHSSTAFHLIHMDTWYPYKVPTNGKYWYFLTIVDDFSRATWTYLMVNKSDAFAILKTFLKFVETQFNAKVKCIRSDNALEFVKERKHRHILEVARVLRFQATLTLRDVQFHEHIFPFAESSSSQFCQPMPIPMPSSKAIYDDPVVLPSNVSIHLKSSRQTKPPDWTKDFVVPSIKPIANHVTAPVFPSKFQCFLSALESNTNPKTFKEAI